MDNIKKIILNKKIRNFFKILIFIFILLYLYYEIDFTQIFKSFSLNLNTFFVILFVFFIRTIVTILIVIRWYYLINLTTDKIIKYRDITGTALYSIFASELFFFGFLSRSFVSLTHNIKFSGVISSTLMEKFFSGYFMGILALLSSLICFTFTDIFFYLNNIYVYLLFIILLFSLFLPILFIQIKKIKNLNFFFNLPILKYFTYYLNWRDLYKPFIASALIQLFNFFGLLAMPFIIGININLFEYALLLPIIIFLAAIPVSITEWGWREFVFVIILQTINLTSEESFSIGLTTGIVYLLCTIIILVIYEIFIRFFYFSKDS